MGERLRNQVEAVVATLAAVVLYTVLGRAHPGAVALVNGFAIAVVVIAFRRGETAGALVGTVCGLVQDSFTAGVFGLSGLTKTLLGFVIGYIARKIHLGSFARLFVFLFLAAFLEWLAWVGFYMLIFGERIYARNGLLFFQPLATAAAGSLILLVWRRLDQRRAA
ncbi:MAG: rod shape-determining protein MreD [Candidatus Aminicenantes bacterium]|nr:rod shape-determining protein MreD [Candidatus Aminicenantes bacterium]